MPGTWLSKSIAGWISVDELRALQLERLRWSLLHAYENVAHYRQAFDGARVHPDDLKARRGLADFYLSTAAPKQARRLLEGRRAQVATDLAVRNHANSAARTNAPSIVDTPATAAPPTATAQTHGRVKAPVHPKTLISVDDARQKADEEAWNEGCKQGREAAEGFVDKVHAEVQKRASISKGDTAKVVRNFLRTDRRYGGGKETMALAVADAVVEARGQEGRRNKSSVRYNAVAYFNPKFDYRSSE